MSRHNRRRTRGGHKNRTMLERSLGGERDTFSSVPDQPPPSTFRSGANAVSARHWHNRYMAWQARERRQHEEAIYLEGEKQRLFGEDDGSGSEEDEDLCEKMMQYFDGLDFINV